MQVVLEVVDAFIDKLTLKRILEILNVPSSNYHRWKKQVLDDEMTLSENETALRKNIQIRHIAVQKHNLNCRVRVKRYRKNGQSPQVCENELNRNFKATKPLEKLVTDITYLPFDTKMLYLSSIMECSNSEIVAYNIGDTQDLAFILDTLNQLPELEAGCVLRILYHCTINIFETYIENSKIEVS